MKLMLFAGIAILYFERAIISQLMPAMAHEFGLSPVQQGWVFSAFSWGYVAFMLPGGYLVFRYGGKACFLAGIGLSALICAIVPFSRGIPDLFVYRFLLGAAEAPVFPACAALVASSYRPGRIALATASFDSGSYLGAACVGALIPWLGSAVGWRIPYALTLVPAAIVIVIGYRSVPSEPRQRREARKTGQVRSVFLGLIKDIRFIGVATSFFCYNFCKGFFLTWFPTVLISWSHLNIAGLSIGSALPFAVAIGAEFLSASILDWLDGRRPERRLANRATVISIGLGLASLIGFTDSAHASAAVVLLMTVSFSSLIGISPALWSTPREIAKEHREIGLVGGALNFVSNIAGIASPIVLGHLQKSSDSLFHSTVLLSVVVLIGALAGFWMRLIPCGRRSEE